MLRDTVLMCKLVQQVAAYVLNAGCKDSKSFPCGVVYVFHIRSKAA